MPKQKTWLEKLNDSKDLPRVEAMPLRMRVKWGDGNMVIPAPLEVDELMRKVPKGKVTTINNIREALARKHSASVACPMMTGICAWIAANAAEEMSVTKKRITPYWRTLKSGNKLNERYPGGIARQRQRLKEEGHRVTKKGKHFVVADADSVIISF